MKNPISIPINLGAALSLLFLSSAAYSQTDAQESRQELEEVIVTARKREESVQDIPVTVASIDSELLKVQGVQRTEDLVNKLPNFIFQTSTINSASNVSVRGVGVAVRNAGFNAGVSFYVDGIYQGRPLNFNQELVDMERVELAFGPQGTLFGRNTIGGVVNFVTRKPGPNYSGWAELEIGDRDDRIVRGAVNIPLVEGQVFARISGSVVNRDGYQFNLHDGRDYGETDRQSVRLHVLGDFDRTQVLFSANWQDGDERAPGFEYQESAIALGGGFTNTFDQVPKIHDINIDTPQHQEFDRKGTSVRIDHAFANGLNLTSITAHMESNSDEIADSDGDAIDILRSDIANSETQKLFSQEVRIESAQDRPVRWSAGGYYLHDDVSNDRSFEFPPPFVALGPLGALHVFVSGQSTLETDSYAAFGNVAWDLTDNFTLEGGLRYTYEDMSSTFDQQELLLTLGGPSTPLAQQVFGPDATGLLIANAPPIAESRDDDAVTGTFTATYRLDNDKMIYGRYSHGFKSGGFNLEPLPDPVPATREFGPEELDNYELGTKTQWFDNRLLVNVTGYFQVYKDLQRIDVIPLEPVGFTRQIRNAGEVEVKGTEVQIQAIPIDGLELRAAYGYNDAEFKEFLLNTGEDLSGQPLSGVPKWNASLGARYSFAIGQGQGYADLGYDLRGNRRLGEDDAAAVTIDGYEVLDARLGYISRGGRWEFSLWARNLLDEEYITARNAGTDFYPGAAQVAFAPPKAYGATLRLNFGE